MEEGLDLAEREQGGLLCCGLGEIHHHAGMWTHIVALAVYPLSLKLCHPGSTLLALARVEVGIEHSEIAAVFVEHLVGFNVGMVDGYVFVLLEGYAVEGGGKPKHAFYHVL